MSLEKEAAIFLESKKMTASSPTWDRDDKLVFIHDFLVDFATQQIEKLREEKEEIKYSVYSKNGTRILKDGHVMFSADIVKDLNRKSYLEEQIEKLNTELEQTKEKLKRCEEFKDVLGEMVVKMLAILEMIRRHDQLLYDEELMIEEFNQTLSQLKDNG